MLIIKKGPTELELKEYRFPATKLCPKAVSKEIAITLIILFPPKVKSSNSSGLWVKSNLEDHSKEPQAMGLTTVRKVQQQGLKG